MKKYFKQLNVSGEVLSLLTYDFVPYNLDSSMVEITEDEYVELLKVINEVLEAGLGEISNNISLKAQAYDIIMGNG